MGNRSGKLKSPGGDEAHATSRRESPLVFTLSDGTTLSIDAMKKLYTDALKKTYKEQYDAVQPIPYIKDRLYCVDRVFVEGGIQQLLGGDSWARLDSYKNIFTDSRNKTNRRIIEGEPGYGKSTLTLQLAYDWCNGIKDSPLYGVDNLILLKLRQMGNFKTIDRAIKMFLLSSEPRIERKDISTIMKHFKSTEILLDGYDEYPDRDKDAENEVGQIIRYQTMKDVDVTLTTRYLPKEYDKSKTQRIKLTGFDEIARDEYIRKAVTGPRNEEAVKKIKRGLKDNPILDDLCQVPLFFVMFAHMTHEREDFQKFKSVTDFFTYMIKCFHEHQKNKSDDRNTYPYIIMYETEYEQLSEKAFEGLNQENQQLLWNKEDMFKRLGQGFYHHYVAIGVLVEERVFDKDGQIVTMVRFYHKIFQEWYASYILIDVVNEAKSSSELTRALRFLDPFDLQYLYRFACGIQPQAGTKIIDHLKNTRDGDKFAILCILERTGEVEDIQQTVQQLCSETVYIRKEDSKLLQRSTVQLLQIASSHDIPISELYLVWSFRGLDGDNIRLESGLCISSLSSIEKISINGDGGDQQLISEEEVTGLINFGIKSRRFKELWFHNCKLPPSINPASIPEEAKSRNVKVFSTHEALSLTLENGKWTKPEDIQTITTMCSGPAVINNRTSESVQRSIIEFLVKASNHDIPIFWVNLMWSFDKIDEDGLNIILKSGLLLPNISSMEVMQIQTEDGREMNEEEVNEILNYIQQNKRLKLLSFYDCVLPLRIRLGPAASTIRSRNVQVYWVPDHNKFHQQYLLHLTTGHWEKTGKW